MSKKKVWILTGSGGMLLLAAAFAWGLSRQGARSLTVCEIQGNSEISAYAGQEIKTRGVVSFNQSELDPVGFFLVDPDCWIPEGSSAGIYVQVADSGGLVHAGDEVSVRGDVGEFEAETRIVTAPDQIEIISLGNPLPLAADLTRIAQSGPGIFTYENWEGQLVEVGPGAVLEPFFSGGKPRYLPSLAPPVGAELICARDGSITLGLIGLDQVWGYKDFFSGSNLLNLSGYLRQETSGYLLQLVPDQNLETITPEMIMAQGGNAAEDLDTVIGTGTLETDGSAPTPSAAASYMPSPTIIPSPTWYPVDLLITELVPNPAGKEPQGEWLEIYNPKSYGQLLTGIKVGDETSPEGNEGVLRFPDGYYIDAREVLVIARQAAEFQSQYGFLPDFEFEDSLGNVPDLLPYDAWGKSGVQFSNSGDEVILLDPWDQIVDELAYGKGSAPGFSSPPDSPAEGNSLERYPPERDRDRGEDWRERENPSPGRLDRSPPTQAASATALPTSSSTAALTPTFTVDPSPTPSPVFTATALSTLTPTIPTPVATGNDPGSPTAECSPTQNQTSTTTPVLTATLYPTGSPSPSPVFSPTTTSTLETSPTPGPSLEPSLTPAPSRTETISPVSSLTTTPSPSITATVIPTPELVLNEIHADPDPDAGDANRDGVVSSDDDEFIELVNSAEHSLDLSGWQIADAVRVRFVFPEGAILDAGCALVVFGGGEPVGDFGPSQVYLASSLGLNNTGDSVVILDESGAEWIRYTYGAEGGEDQSLTLSPDLVGEPPLIPHSLVPEAGGALFSPGTRLDGSPFPACQQ